MEEHTSTSCSSCGKTDNLKKCGRCKQVSYCSGSCQKADWTAHKKSCSFTVTTTNNDSESDALTILRNMPSPRTMPKTGGKKKSTTAMKAFNTAEIRLMLFSMLPAKTLLTTQRVCRSWYLHVALEVKLQERLFLAPGPGTLVLSAVEGKILFTSHSAQD